MSTVVTLEERADRARARPRGPDARRGDHRRASTTAWRSATPTREAQALAAPLLPPGARIVPLAETATLGETSNGLLVTFGFAILVVFLVLAAQFESFVSAVIVMATVPLGLGCAMVAMVLTGVSLNVYSQIGLVLLVGIIAKNGILVVEFANQLRDHGAERARGDRGGLPHPAPPGDDDDGRDHPRRRAAAHLRAAPAPRRARRSAGSSSAASASRPS